MTEEIFQQGAKILKEGKPDDGQFLLLDRDIDVLKKTLYKESFVTASLSCSDYYTRGEIALIDHDAHSVTV